VTVIKLLPGIGNPMLLTCRQFAGICNALIDSDADTTTGDHRAKVEADMRRMANGSR
jgi:hypothetical protein